MIPGDRTQAPPTIANNHFGDGPHGNRQGNGTFLTHSVFSGLGRGAPPGTGYATLGNGFGQGKTTLRSTRECLILACNKPKNLSAAVFNALVRTEP
jgi:hypothetical protein